MFGEFFAPPSTGTWNDISSILRDGAKYVVCRNNTVYWEYDIVFYDKADKNYPWHSVTRWAERYPENYWQHCYLLQLPPYIIK